MPGENAVSPYSSLSYVLDKSLSILILTILSLPLPIFNHQNILVMYNCKQTSTFFLKGVTLQLLHKHDLCTYITDLDLETNFFEPRALPATNAPLTCDQTQTGGSENKCSFLNELLGSQRHPFPSLTARIAVLQ